MRVAIVVDSRIRVPTAGLAEACVDDVKAAFSHHNPKREAMRRMGVPHWGEPAIIHTWRAEASAHLTVPRGGMERVRRVLREHGVEWTVADHRGMGDPRFGGQIPEHKLELWAHQARCVEAFLPKEQGIVRAPTGCGKTSLGFAVAARLNVATLVLVDVRALFEQWQERAHKELGLRDVGIIQGPTRRLRPFTVGMMQTVAKRMDAELVAAFGLVIVDEIQGVAAPTFMSSVDPLRARYRLGISADERRKDQKEFLIEDVFGEVVADVDRAELEDSGTVLDVEVRVVPTEFRADWYGLPGDGDERELDFGRLLEEMAADEERNALVTRHACAEVARGSRVVVMAHRREHCQVLSQRLVEQGLMSGFLIGGEDYRAQFQQTLRALLAGELRAAVGTLQAVGKGLDMPAVDRGIVATPLAGNKQKFGQARGRFCRAPPGKKDAALYYLWDQHCGFARGHLENLVRWNRRVLVREGGDRWTPAREYLKSRRLRAA